jgi:integrase
MQLRIRTGKGAKGRVLSLSKRLLKELVDYWRAQRQAKAGHDSPWLFLGERAGEPMSLSQRAEDLLTVQHDGLVSTRGPHSRRFGISGTGSLLQRRS